MLLQPQGTALPPLLLARLQAIGQARPQQQQESFQEPALLALLPQVTAFFVYLQRIAVCVVQMPILRDRHARITALQLAEDAHVSSLQKITLSRV